MRKDSNIGGFILYLCPLKHVYVDVFTTHYILYKTWSVNPPTTAEVSKSLKTMKAKTDPYGGSFFTRTLLVWNRLPDSVVFQPTATAIAFTSAVSKLGADFFKDYIF